MPDCFSHLPSPGGLALLERGLRLCAFRKGAFIADIGCGNGAAVKYINGCGRIRAVGVDIDARAVAAANKAGGSCIVADAAKLPFSDGEIDGAVFRCSYSKIDKPDYALREAARVLKPGGRILLLDFFAGEREAYFSGIMGRVEFKEKICSMLEKHGLHMIRFEDCTRELREYWGQLIFDYGADELEMMLGGCADILSAKCRYGLFIAEKRK